MYKFKEKIILVMLIILLCFFTINASEVQNNIHALEKQHNIVIHKMSALSVLDSDSIEILPSGLIDLTKYNIAWRIDAIKFSGNDTPWNSSFIVNAIKKKVRFRHVFKNYLKNNPPVLGGTVTYEIEFAPSGKVLKVFPPYSNMVAPKLELEFARKIKKWRHNVVCKKYYTVFLTFSMKLQRKKIR